MNDPVEIAQPLPPLSDAHAWMTPQAVSTEIGRAASTLAAWRKQNLYIDFYKFGRRVLYLRRDVESFNSSCLVRCKTAEVVRHARQS